MAEFEMAVNLDEELDDWKPHPTRRDQTICHVPCIDSDWATNKIEDYIKLNACFAWT